MNSSWKLSWITGIPFNGGAGVPILGVRQRASVILLSPQSGSNEDVLPIHSCCCRLRAAMTVASMRVERALSRALAAEMEAGASKLRAEAAEARAEDLATRLDHAQVGHCFVT